MKEEELRRLLRRPEDPALEFKREWYKINDTDSNTEKYQRAELIKDILALANGSPSTAGKKALLIIGADKQFGPDGSRVVYDVGNLLPDREQF